MHLLQFILYLGGLIDCAKSTIKLLPRPNTIEPIHLFHNRPKASCNINTPNHNDCPRSYSSFRYYLSHFAHSFATKPSICRFAAVLCVWAHQMSNRIGSGQFLVCRWSIHLLHSILAQRLCVCMNMNIFFLLFPLCVISRRFCARP